MALVLQTTFNLIQPSTFIKATLEQMCSSIPFSFELVTTLLRAHAHASAQTHLNTIKPIEGAGALVHHMPTVA
jgi:hypothetical protein